MAVSDNPHNDALERDAHLARLLRAVGEEAPPAALDAAIAAAARREAGARPQLAGGGGGAPLVLTERNWYVPVSIAAVVVLSVSLVTLVREEKGAQLEPPPLTTPDMTHDKAREKTKVAAELAASSEKKAFSADKVGKTAMADAAVAEAADAAKRAAAADAAVRPKATGESAKQPRLQAQPPVKGSVATRNDADAGAMARQRNAAEPAAAQTAPSAVESSAVATPPAAPPALAREARPEPFPAQREREVPPAVVAPPPSVPAVADARLRGEADRAAARVAPMQDAAPAKPAAPARRITPQGGIMAQRAPELAERSETQSAPLISAAKPMARFEAKRAPLWQGLEDAPAEKWLERLAEFRRDRRTADADELFDEFRRRFPDHPAAVR